MSVRAILAFRSDVHPGRIKPTLSSSRPSTRFLRCAKEAGLRAGIYCRSVEYARDMAAKGFDLVTVTSDEHLLSAGAEALARFSA